MTVGGKPDRAPSRLLIVAAAGYGKSAALDAALVLRRLLLDVQVCQQGMHVEGHGRLFPRLPPGASRRPIEVPAGHPGPTSAAPPISR